MNSMSKLTITPKKQYAVKRKLYELADSGYSNPDMAYVPPPLSSNDVDEMPVPPEKKKIRKNKKNKIWNTDTCLLCYADSIFFPCNGLGIT